MRSPERSRCPARPRSTAGLNIMPWGLGSLPEELGVLGNGTCAAVQASLVLSRLDAMSPSAKLRMKNSYHALTYMFP